VLIAVRPALLGDLIARCFDSATIDVVRASDDGTATSDDRDFDVVITTGVPPSDIAAGAVLWLPDRLSAGDAASLLTGEHLRRVPIEGPRDVVAVVQDVLVAGDGPPA
jgi:hypothetical protein